jgi:hypothetical protein
VAWNVGGSIRVAGVADAAAIAAVHEEAWRETYMGIVPVQVLAGLSVDRRTEIAAAPSADNEGGAAFSLPPEAIR